MFIRAHTCAPIKEEKFAQIPRILAFWREKKVRAKWYSIPKHWTIVCLDGLPYKLLQLTSYGHTHSFHIPHVYWVWQNCVCVCTWTVVYLALLRIGWLLKRGCGLHALVMHLWCYIGNAYAVMCVYIPAWSVWDPALVEQARSIGLNHWMSGGEWVSHMEGWDGQKYLQVVSSSGLYGLHSCTWCRNVDLYFWEEKW